MPKCSECGDMWSGGNELISPCCGQLAEREISQIESPEFLPDELDQYFEDYLEYWDQVGQYEDLLGF